MTQSEGTFSGIEEDDDDIDGYPGDYNSEEMSEEISEEMEDGDATF